MDAENTNINEMLPNRAAHCLSCNKFITHYTPKLKDLRCLKCKSQQQLVSGAWTFDENGPCFVYDVHGTIRAKKPGEAEVATNPNETVYVRVVDKPIATKPTDD